MNWPFSSLDDGAGPVSRMERAMRSFDWGSSALGPVDRWPVPLRSAVRILLDCQLPMYLGWGPDYIQLFNDAYLPILGDKADAALGNRASATWSEI